MMYKIRTIDVWDTLIRRDCHPECIKLATAKHLLLGWTTQLKPQYRDSWLLYKERLEIERKIAEQDIAVGNDGEYKITQVIAVWIQKVFIDSTNIELTKDLVDYEFSVEVDRSFVDPEIITYLSEHDAEKTFFLSDFYMGAEMLSRLLSKKGLNTLAAEGFSSCDVGLNKRSGNIYSYIHSIHKILPKQHIHIGDNEWSDVSSPRSLGIEALHYLPEAAHSERIHNAHLFSSRNVLFDHLQRACFSLYKNASKQIPDKQAAALRLGVESAPLFISFALWIAEQTIINNLDKVFFLTREGEFFHQVFLMLFPNSEIFGHKLPSTDILAVSRLSTFAPSIGNISIKEMSRIWSLFKSQTIDGIFSTLGLDIDNFTQLLDELRILRSDIITNPINNKKIYDLFNSQIFIEAATSSIEYKKNIFKEYLIEKNIKSNKKIGVVDIGWRGTIQDNISLIIPSVHFHGMYLGLHQVINQQSQNVSKSAYVFDENQSKTPKNYFNNYSAMEMLCNSPYGSVMGYFSDADGTTIAKRDVNEMENLTYDSFVKPFQDGVLLAAKHWQPYLERYVISSNELHELSLHIWRNLNYTSNEELTEAYLKTPQHDIFCFGDIFKRNEYPSLLTIFLSPIIKSKRRHLIEYISRTNWTIAIENTKDLNFFHRKLLVFIFHFAHFIKRKNIKIKFTIKYFTKIKF